VAYGLDRVDPEKDIRIILIEAADRILPALPERISEATHRLLANLGVEVRTSAKVSEVRADGVCLASGEFIPSELVVWSAGVKGPEFLRNLDGLEVNGINQLVVTPTLQTSADPDIFAIGDCAACPREGHATPVPPRAQAAHQQAAHVVKQLRRRLAGQKLEPFVYRDFGSLVSLGKYSTVGSLMGFLVGKNIFIEGYFARLMYRSLYKMHEYALHGGGKVIPRLAGARTLPARGAAGQIALAAKSGSRNRLNLRSWAIRPDQAEISDDSSGRLKGSGMRRRTCPANANRSLYRAVGLSGARALRPNQHATFCAAMPGRLTAPPGPGQSSPPISATKMQPPCWRQAVAAIRQQDLECEADFYLGA
jgi:hypothetical protein